MSIQNVTTVNLTPDPDNLQPPVAIVGTHICEFDANAGGIPISADAITALLNGSATSIKISFSVTGLDGFNVPPTAIYAHDMTIVNQNNEQVSGAFVTNDGRIIFEEGFGKFILGAGVVGEDNAVIGITTMVRFAYHNPSGSTDEAFTGSGSILIFIDPSGIDPSEWANIDRIDSHPYIDYVTNDTSVRGYL